MTRIHSEFQTIACVREARADIDLRIRLISQVLRMVELTLPPETSDWLARIQESIAELIAIMDCIVMGESVALTMPEFAEIYRSKLSQIGLRLHLLQRQTCQAHRAALDALQTDVQCLGVYALPGAHAGTQQIQPPDEQRHFG
jgi:hypothetical protein